MWLSGLHIPESYLTALIQAACRKNGWPLDRSTLYTTVTQFVSDEEIHERPSTGCYVKGLYLEGASWNLEESVLGRPIPKQLVVELPILRVIPIEAQKLKLQVNIVSVKGKFQVVKVPYAEFICANHEQVRNFAEFYFENTHREGFYRWVYVDRMMRRKEKSVLPYLFHKTELYLYE